MTAGDARDLYRLLVAEGIRCWVIGGWGVDALLGRVTRAHKDLDVLLVRGEHGRAWALLHAAGFRLELTWEESTDVDLGDGPLPTAYVLGHPDGRQLDVHVLDDDLTPLWVTDQPWAEGGLDAYGTIDGTTVACISARMQRLAHTGYELPAVQQRDLELLDAHCPSQPRASRP